MLCAAVGAVLAVGVASTFLPGCSECHLRDSDFKAATSATSHGGVDCVACHVQTRDAVSRAKFGAYQVFGMWLPLADASGSDATLVRDRSCLECHEAVNDGVVEARGLRIQHSSCADGRRCTDCHSEVGHGPETTWPRVTSMTDCVSCHKQSKTSVACKTCHTGRVESLVFSESEFAVTHGDKWQDTHGMGRMSTCSVCHAADDCGRCHGSGVPHTADFSKEHPAYSVEVEAKCDSCHRPVFCEGCHGTEMPHPASFAERHSAIVKAEGEEPCLRCHAKPDCDNCHESHVHPGGSVGTVPSPRREGM